MVQIRENISDLIVERYFGGFKKKRLIDWAVSLLEEGKVSNNLSLLANAGNKTDEEIEFYFLESIKELKLDIPSSKNEQISEYAIRLIKKALNQETSIHKAFLNILKLSRIVDNNTRYCCFTEIEDDLDRLFYGKNTTLNGLTLKNQDAYILEEFKLFSEMENLGIPTSSRTMEFCLECHQLGNPVPKKKFQFKRPFMYYVLACEHCKSENLKPYNSHFVKRKIILSFKK